MLGRRFEDLLARSRVKRFDVLEVGTETRREWVPAALASRNVASAQHHIHDALASLLIGCQRHALPSVLSRANFHHFLTTSFQQRYHSRLSF